MTRDEIYDHLAQVYLGKKNKTDPVKKRQFNAWLVINIFITAVIFVSSFYGLSAFLTGQKKNLQNRVVYSLHNGPIRINYNLGYPYPSVKTFSLAIPDINTSRYKALQFSIRGTEDGYPGRVRIEIKNDKRETASIFIEDVGMDWKEFKVSLADFKRISDWTNLAEVSFILESWNAEKQKGVVLIDDLCFSAKP